MIIRNEHLIVLNNKNRVQHVHIILEKENFEDIYYIKRFTNQFGGKQTIQPIICIKYGNTKRTVSKQATMRLNLIIKNYLNKGYVLLSSITETPYNKLTEEEIIKLFSITKSTIPKPMLCKSVDSCSISIFEKNWYCSRKINGLRLLMYYKNEEIHTISSGERSYDLVTTHLRKNKKLIKLFEENPYLILDGELYIHDSSYSLGKLFNLLHSNVWIDECNKIEYWIYDYISEEPFKDRYETLMNFKDSLQDESNIKIIDHKLISGYLSIKREHDKYIKEGFDGLMMRNPDREYGINKRSAFYMLKMKDRKIDRLKIIDIKDGLTSDGIYFVLETKFHKTVYAKPKNNIKLKSQYLSNKEKFIGKIAICSFLYYSSGGIPLQPTILYYE